ncbi:MAG: GntR family transcriptional regulator [Bacillota bacterium]|nr:GntR family transcriptional regulator [Bacillota bacterium]
MAITPRPVFLQVEEEIRALIDRELKPGDRLPSEQELAATLGVSRSTLREALRILENEGIIRRKHGVGSFVQRRVSPIQGGIEELASISQLIRSLGMEPGTSSLEIREEPLGPQIASRLHVPTGTRSLTFDRVRTANGEPVVYGLDRVLTKFLPNPPTPEEFIADYGGSVFALLEANSVHVEYVKADIRPVIAGRRIARRLGLGHSRPLLLLEQVHYDAADTPIVYGEDYFHPDYFHFWVIRRAVKAR